MKFEKYRSRIADEIPRWKKRIQKVRLSKKEKQVDVEEHDLKEEEEENTEDHEHVHEVDEVI